MHLGSKGAFTLGEIFSGEAYATSALPGVFLLRTFRRVQILARPGEGFSQKPKSEKRDSRGEAGEGTRIRPGRICGEGEAFSAQCERALRMQRSMLMVLMMHSLLLCTRVPATTAVSQGEDRSL